MKQKKFGLISSKRFIFFCLLQFVFSLVSFGQTDFIIKGKVTNENKEPLQGVTIVSKENPNRGVTSNTNGEFSIQAKTKDELLFSYVGYQNVLLKVGSQKNISVVMITTEVNLDDVVVVGYGTQKKGDLTGAVTSIRRKDMNTGVNATFAGLVQGKVAGVQITQASTEPGGGTTIQIRGAGSINAGSEPLYVVDGLPIETGQVISGTGASISGTRTPRSPISNINPSDIESIEILKDASATAIYGARGANGVVLVTTKKGSSGAMKINYNGYTGIQEPVNMIEMLNAKDYQRILNEIQATPGSNVTAAERVNEIQNGGTNWQDQILRNAMVQNHGLSISGGDNKTKYFASFNYFNQNGVLIESGFKRYDTRLNLQHKSNKFLVGVNYSTSYTHDDFTTVGYGVNEGSDVLYAARNYDPTMSIFNSAGRYNASSFTDTENPLALVNGERSKADNYRTLGTVFGEYTILNGWTAKVNIGADVRNSRRDAYVSRLTRDGFNNDGIGSILSGTRNNYLGEFTSTYTRSLRNSSSFTALGGITYQKFTNSDFSGTGRGFPSDETMTNNMESGNPALYTMSSSKNNNKLLSYLGRVNYNLFDKFFFTASMRVDGSSRFGANNKYGYFPSGAFAWKMHNYNFIQDLNVFSSLKFRASIGRTGNESIGNFLSITTLGTGGVAILDGGRVVTLNPLRISNPDIKWETTEQSNVGFDMGFFKNRLSVSVDYYQKSTYDMLFALPIPPSSGFNTITQNIGSIENRGFELTVNSKNLEGKFKWNTSLNLSTLKNRVTDIGGIQQINYVDAGWTRQVALIKVGEALNSFYGYKTNGIWQSQEEITASKTRDPVKPGDVRYVDINGDNTVNGNDRVVLGKSFPSVMMGLTNVFSYKNFELNIFIDAVTGVSMINNAMAETYFPVSHRRNRIAEPYLNRWTQANPSSKYPSFVNPGGQGGKSANDLVVEDASYIRIQSAQINYQLLLKNNKVFNRMNFYISGQNLFIWTKYRGQDPTTNSNGNSSLKIDFNSYPVARTFIFGIELNF